VDAVVFDLGNVLVEWNPRLLLSDAFIDETDFFVWNAELDQGASFAETVARIRQLFPHHAAECDAFRDRWPETIGEVITEAVEVVDRLKSEGVALFVLSNSSAETLGRCERVADVLARFDGVMVSGEVGILKPDPRIYALAVERFNLDPPNTMFVDDSAANVEAAIACGWQAIHFQRGGARPSWWAK
jgi:2-haloacid dehalogenase